MGARRCALIVIRKKPDYNSRAQCCVLFAHTGGDWGLSPSIHLITYMFSSSCCSINTADTSCDLLHTAGPITLLCTQQFVFDHSRTCILPQTMLQKAIQSSCETTKGERTYHFLWSFVLLASHLCSYNCMPSF